MGKLIHNGKTYADINKGIPTVYSIKDCFLIGYSASEARHSPIDANNYIEVVDNDVILHRTNSSYDVVLYVPIPLVAGELCTILFDSVTNTDMTFYVQYGSSITTDPVSFTQRIISLYYNNTYVKGVTFVAPEEGYYNVAIWSNNTSPIVASNPRYCIYR